MKAIWKGSISFGLVNIPVNLYSAVASQSLGFKLLHGKCNTAINYLRWCPKCKVDVKWENIVKGMPVKDGGYIVLSKEKLEELKPEKSDLIEITEFVSLDQLSPIYQDDHYYLLPAKDTDKAFFLFFQALEDVKLVAIGKFVLHEKEHVCGIQPYKKGLLLSTLNYAYEIKDLKKLDELKAPEKISPQELKLAKELISKLTKKKFDITQFKDTYAEKLKAKIKQLAKGKKISKPEKVKKPTIVKAPSLVEVLKASLEEHPAGRRAR